jgi:hypothetical protein
MLETRSAFEQARLAASYLLVERFGYHVKPSLDLLGVHHSGSQCSDPLQEAGCMAGWKSILTPISGVSSYMMDSCESN